MSCPFCEVAGGRETETNALSDVVLRDELTTAFVSPKWWEASPGHVIVVPNEHVRDVYEIADGLLGAVYGTARRVAVAMKLAYRCEGTSMRQHNERGGGQEVGHFHVHVFPRSEGDRLYERNGMTHWTVPEERLPLAERLRAALEADP
jgi:histidine triad (HIT) family protein